MRNSDRLAWWQELWQPLQTPRVWQGLAIAQVMVLLTLLLTWPQQPVTLTFVVPEPEAKYWSALIAAFQTQNPDIRLALVQGPYTTDEVETTYTSAFQSGSKLYDLVYMDTIWVSKFVAAGWLRSLSSQLTPAELAAFLPADLESGRYQEDLYRIPFRSDVGVLYYRKDLLEAQGARPPQTFAELLHLSQVLQGQQQTRWGYLWQGKQYEGLTAVFIEVLEGFGGFWVNPNTYEVGLDQPAALTAVQFLQGTIAQGFSPPEVRTYTEDIAFQTFQAGEAAFLRSWPSVWARAMELESLRDKVGITAMVHAPGFQSSPCRGGWGFAIAKEAKHPAEAWRVIQFFTSEAVQRQFVLASGALPSRRALFTDQQLVQKYPHLPTLLPMVEQAVSRPRLPEYDQLSQILQRYLSAALSGQPTVEAMRAAAAETRQLLKQKQG